MRLWNIFKTVHTIKMGMKEEKKKRDAYLRMNTVELLALPDQELYNAAKVRLEKRMENQRSFDTMTFAQKVFYALDYYEMEVNNGGLCQFFVNSSRMVAPYISDYLAEIRELEHKVLFDLFIQKHQIDLTDLSSFIIDDISEYENQVNRYPFDSFDEQFYNLPSLENGLVHLIRANIGDF